VAMCRRSFHPSKLRFWGLEFCTFLARVDTWKSEKYTRFPDTCYVWLCIRARLQSCRKGPKKSWALASATGSKPSAFQAESFQRLCWIIVRWSSTSRIRTLYGMSNTI
jgi:hypothetical protein